MSRTITECLEHARECEWYAAHTGNEEDRKFLLRKAKDWKSRPERKSWKLERQHELPLSTRCCCRLALQQTERFSKVSVD